jgi:hypothetical protein
MAPPDSQEQFQARNAGDRRQLFDGSAIYPPSVAIDTGETQELSVRICGQLACGSAPPGQPTPDAASSPVKIGARIKVRASSDMPGDQTDLVRNTAGAGPGAVVVPWTPGEPPSPPVRVTSGTSPPPPPPPATTVRALRSQPVAAQVPWRMSEAPPPPYAAKTPASSKYGEPGAPPPL